MVLSTNLPVLSTETLPGQDWVNWPDRHGLFSPVIRIRLSDKEYVFKSVEWWKTEADRAASESVRRGESFSFCVDHITLPDEINTRSDRINI